MAPGKEEAQNEKNLELIKQAMEEMQVLKHVLERVQKLEEEASKSQARIAELERANEDKSKRVEALQQQLQELQRQMEKGKHTERVGGEGEGMREWGEGGI